MAFSGVSDRDNLIPSLRRMISSKVEVLKFAVAASGQKDGLLCLNKKDNLKKVDEASQTLATLAVLVARVLKEPGVAPAAMPMGRRKPIKPRANILVTKDLVRVGAGVGMTGQGGPARFFSRLGRLRYS